MRRIQIPLQVPIGGPAAAVIPAPIAYIKVVAVKKLVVGLVRRFVGPPFGWVLYNIRRLSGERCCALLHGSVSGAFTLRKLECSRQAFALNMLAWNNAKRPRFFLLVSTSEVMINMSCWGHLYLTVRGEILGFVKDRLVRKHLPKMFFLIKNESWGIEGDQIPP